MVRHAPTRSQSEVCIRSYDGACRKVDALPHEISSNSAILPLPDARIWTWTSKSRRAPFPRASESDYGFVHEREDLVLKAIESL